MTRILLVEDEEIIVRNERDLLQKLGYDVAGVSVTGLDAIEKAIELNPDLILMDIHLKGGMDGVDAAMKINEKISVPIIYLTGHYDNPTLRRAQKSEPYGFITKPFEIDNLRTSIETALNKFEMDLKLRKSETEFKAIVSNLGEGIGIVDEDETFTFVNPAAHEIFGVPEGHLVGKKIESFIDQETLETVLSQSKNRRLGKTSKYQIEIMRPDGEKRDLLVTSTPNTDMHGNYIGAFGIFRDITESRQVEETLHMFKKFADESRLGFGWADLDGRIVYVNDSLCYMLGEGQKDDVLGKIVTKYYDEETQLRLAEEIFPTILQEGQWMGELDIHSADGRIVSTYNSLFALQNNHGKPMSFANIVTDISERRKIEAEIGQARKLEAVGQLAAGIAHEINTPTQYVGDNNRFLQEAFDDILRLFTEYQQFLQVAKAGNIDQHLIDKLEALIDEVDVPYLLVEVPKAIEQSLEGIDRITHIVRAMKEFSHPGSKEKMPIDINKAIETTITVTRNEWKYVAEMKTDFDPNLPRVACLQDELNQVILNLIINAAHAISDVMSADSSDKGLITISTAANENWVEIRIQDTGIGIPKAIRDKVFDPFFTTKETGKGTGQGLAISYNVIVKKHEGSLTFETREGKGTTFLIRLPVGG